MIFSQNCIHVLSFIDQIKEEYLLCVASRWSCILKEWRCNHLVRRRVTVGASSSRAWWLIEVSRLLAILLRQPRFLFLNDYNKLLPSVFRQQLNQFLRIFLLLLSYLVDLEQYFYQKLTNCSFENLIISIAMFYILTYSYLSHIGLPQSSTYRIKIAKVVLNSNFSLLL